MCVAPRSAPIGGNFFGDLADFVLHTMPRDERVLVEEQYDRLCKAVELWIADGTEKAVSTMGR